MSAHETPDRSPIADQASHRDDAGFTLIEILIVMLMMGIVVGALAVTFTLVARVSPDTEIRIDDARSTRGLAAWLSFDTTSAPRFAPEQAAGGIDTSSTANACGGSGNNIVQFRWSEDSHVDRTFVASYRYVVDGAEGRIIRVACSKTSSTPFGGTWGTNLTSGLDPTTPPTIVLNRVVPADPASEVESVDMVLTARSGESVLVQTGSRNPTDGF